MCNKEDKWIPLRKKGWLLLGEDIEESSDKEVFYPAPEKIEPNKIYSIDDKDFVKTYISAIFGMMKDRYSDIGGIEDMVKSPQMLLSKTDLFKIVFDDRLDVLACSTYKYYLKGNKLFLCAGCRNGGTGAKALESIIISDIQPYDNWFWGEASGAIEHYFQKHHGNAIPNYMVWKFLNKPREEIKLDPRGPEIDPIHYSRILGDPQKENWQRKSMWGYRDEAMAKEVLSEIQKDENFRLKSETVTEELFPAADETTRSTEKAIGIVAEITEFNEEKECHEMLPSWSKKLDEAISIINEQKDSVKDIGMKKRLTSALNAAKILRQNMPVLRLRKLEL